jgi:hypothetical protein
VRVVITAYPVIKKAREVLLVTFRREAIAAYLYLLSRR